jgi:nicotinamidase-related amidase
MAAAEGFGERQGAGSRPALVVVDLVNGFPDPESPLSCDAEGAVAATARLLDAARAAGAPVAFTTVAYDEAGARVARAFLAVADRQAGPQEAALFDIDATYGDVVGLEEAQALLRGAG